MKYCYLVTTRESMIYVTQKHNSSWLNKKDMYDLMTHRLPFYYYGETDHWSQDNKKLNYRVIPVYTFKEYLKLCVK